jgi:cytochrome c peroxidase
MALFFGSCCKEKESPFAPTPFTPAYHSRLMGYYREPPANPSTKEGILLGKTLFFDKSLSANNTISCASCHRPEHAFADVGPVSFGINGTPGIRNTPGLFNTGLQNRFFWDGRDTSLEQQSLHPIQDKGEMAMELPALVLKLQNNPKYPPLFLKAFGSQTVTIENVSKAIAQFERSLVAVDTKYDRYLQGLQSLSPLEEKGRALFFTHPDPFAGALGLRGGNCGDCHLPQTLLGRQDGFFGFFNNGLGIADPGLQKITGLPGDLGKFKVPQLRNVALTAPYMHDGRFQTLEAVLDHYNSEDIFYSSNVDPQIQLASNQKFGTSLKLTPEEKQAIIAFLHTLTDRTALKFVP